MENATTVSNMYLQKLKIKSKKCKDEPNETGSIHPRPVSETW